MFLCLNWLPNRTCLLNIIFGVMTVFANRRIRVMDSTTVHLKLQKLIIHTSIACDVGIWQWEYVGIYYTYLVRH